ncbi:MAG: hypothetical protein Kow00129_07340 [Thermoleophilia bacterium]
MLSKLCKRMKGESGFTLIELLVVIIIIAILAAIAIPTFLGQRQKAQDSAAKSLVRNAMTAMESQYVDSRTFDGDLSTELGNIEPSITFNHDNDYEANVEADLEAVASLTADDAVTFSGTTTEYHLGTQSESGNFFGVYANKGTSGGTTYYKSIDGTFSSGW